MVTLENSLDTFSVLKPDPKQALLEQFQPKDAKKNQILVIEKEHCRKLFFVQSGMMRAFYLKDGKAVTDWFGTEGTFMTSIHSFYNDLPSKQFIQTGEASTLFTINKQDLNTLCLQYPEIERWFREITTQHLIRLQERIMALQFYSAKERYDLLLEKHPQVLQKAQVSHIASYLGISLETLSRIRST